MGIHNTILLLEPALPFGKAERIHRIAPSWSHKWELYGIEIVKSFTAKTWHHKTANSLQFNRFDLFHFSMMGFSQLCHPGKLKINKHFFRADPF